MLKTLASLVLLLQISFVSASQLGTDLVQQLFQDDLSLLNCQFSELAQLERLVEETNQTQTQLLHNAHSLAQYIVPDTSIAKSLLGISAPEGELLMDVPGFLWGFCCSAAGMLMVYLLIEDPAIREREVYAAIRGCTIGTLLWIGLYVWFAYYAAYY